MKKNYILEINETLKEFNWEVLNLYIQGNSIFGCCSKHIAIRPTLENLRFELQYPTIGIEGLYAASEDDSEDVFNTYKALTKDILNKNFSDNTIFVPCYTTSDNMVLVETNKVSKDLLREYKDCGEITASIKKVEKLYVDNVKNTNVFHSCVDISDKVEMSKISLVAVNIHFEVNETGRPSIKFTNLFDELVSFIY